jgi:hypothetical protein
MAQSFWQPGVECSVAAIQGRSPDPWTQWNLFCDCMFRADSAEHKRCRQKHCAVPWGCDRTWFVKDPFDVTPGLLAPPWTEVGAATRNIPHRAPTIVTTGTQLLTIRPENWNPLILWQTYWTNPAKYAVWVGQAQVIGTLLAPLTAGASTLWAGFMVAAGTAPPFQLLPGALVEVARQGKDVGKEIVAPAAVGSIKNLGTSLKYLGNCGVGINIPCGAGILVQRAAQDQIDDGTINGADPVTQAIIRFLAEQGENFISTAVKTVTSAPSKALARQVITIMRSGFVLVREAARAAQDQNTTKIADTLVTVSDVADIMAKGLEDRAPAIDIVDAVVYRLLGISIKTFKAQLQSDIAGARSSIEAAQKSKGISLQQVMLLINDVGGVMNRIAQFVTEVEAKAQTSLGDLARMFTGANAALDGAKAELAQVQSQAQARNIQTSTPGSPRSSTTFSPPPKSLPGAKPMKTASLISTFIGGAGGALLAGPLGAAAGAAVGYAAGGIISGGDSGGGGGGDSFPDMAPLPMLTIGRASPGASALRQAGSVNAIKAGMLAAQGFGGFGRFNTSRAFVEAKAGGGFTADAGPATTTPRPMQTRTAFLTAAVASDPTNREILRKLAGALIQSGEAYLTWSRVVDLAKRLDDRNAAWLMERPSVFNAQPLTTYRGEQAIDLRKMLTALDAQEQELTKAAQVRALEERQALREAAIQAAAAQEKAAAEKAAQEKAAQEKAATVKVWQKGADALNARRTPPPAVQDTPNIPVTQEAAPPVSSDPAPEVAVVQTPDGLKLVAKPRLGTGAKVGIGLGLVALIYVATRRSA